MNIVNFTKNLSAIQKNLYESEFLTKTRLSSFSDDKLALLLTEISKIAVQSAMSLEELEQKERALALSEEKTRQEMEILALNSKAQNKIAVIEALKGLIQADAMAKASGDNAAINKANAYNAFLNIVANGENTDMIRQHTKGVLDTINTIDVNPMDAYNKIINELKNEAHKLLNGFNNKEVFIYAPKVEIEVGETIKLMGYSIYGENPCKFEIGGIETFGKTTYFTAGEVGEVEVTFSAQNAQGQWVSDSLKLKVVKTEFEKLDWNRVYDR